MELGMGQSQEYQVRMLELLVFYICNRQGGMDASLRV